MVEPYADSLESFLEQTSEGKKLKCPACKNEMIITTVVSYECVTHMEHIEAGRSFFTARPREWYDHIAQYQRAERHHFIIQFSDGSTNEAEVCNGKITYFPEMRTRELVNPYANQPSKQPRR